MVRVPTYKDSSNNLRVHVMFCQWYNSRQKEICMSLGSTWSICESFLETVSHSERLINNGTTWDFIVQNLLKSSLTSILKALTVFQVVNGCKDFVHYYLCVFDKLLIKVSVIFSIRFFTSPSPQTEYSLELYMPTCVCIKIHVQLKSYIFLK